MIFARCVIRASLILKWWIYEYRILELRDEELNVKKTITVIDATFAAAKRKPEKKIRLVRDSNPWPLRYRYSALTNWANKPTGPGWLGKSVDNVQLSDQLPVGLLAQLVRALQRYRRGQGFESRTSLNFLGFLFAAAKVASITAMVFFIFT